MAEVHLTYDTEPLTFTAEEDTDLRLTVPLAGYYQVGLLTMRLPAGATLRLWRDGMRVDVYQDSGGAVLIGRQAVASHTFTRLPG